MKSPKSNPRYRSELRFSTRNAFVGNEVLFKAFTESFFGLSQVYAFEARAN